LLVIEQSESKDGSEPQSKSRYALAVQRQLTGGWRITEMELWDSESIDLLGPACIEINADGTGTFQFIAVEGNLDRRFNEPGADTAIEFSWDGNDESDHASGRGWINLSPDDSLHGRIFFHMGDDSSFRATRVQMTATTSTAVPSRQERLAGRGEPAPFIEPIWTNMQHANGGATLR
jgi:hypothetical protein